MFTSFNVNGSNDTKKSNVVTGSNTKPTFKKSCNAQVLGAMIGTNPNGLKCIEISLSSPDYDGVIATHEFYLGGTFGNRIEQYPKASDINSLKLWEPSGSYSMNTINQMSASKSMYAKHYGAVANNLDLTSGVIEALGLPQGFNSLSTEERMLELDKLVQSNMDRYFELDAEARKELRLFFKAIDIANGESIASLTRQRVILAYMLQIEKFIDYVNGFTHGKVDFDLDKFIVFQKKDSNKIKEINLESVTELAVTVINMCTGLWTWAVVANGKNGSWIKTLMKCDGKGLSHNGKGTNADTARIYAQASLNGQSTTTVPTTNQVNTSW